MAKEGVAAAASEMTRVVDVVGMTVVDVKMAGWMTHVVAVGAAASTRVDAVGVVKK